jgi:G3E family GTPase
MILFPSPDIGLFGRRQRHARGHRIPVTIVRGRAPHEGGAAIVIDSFGEDDVAPLPGGCACCTVRAKLQSALRGLLAEREQKPFSQIAIESAAALGPILRTFVSEQALGSDFHVEDAPPLDGDRFILLEEAPLSWNAFGRFVTTLTALRGPDLLRMKGLLNVEGSRGPVAVHCMGHLAARPVELQVWPDGERASRLEFVTHSIEEQTVRDLLNSVGALS